MFPEFLQWAEHPVEALQHNSYFNRLDRKVARRKRRAVQLGIRKYDTTTAAEDKAIKEREKYIRAYFMQIHASLLIMVFLATILRLGDVLVSPTIQANLVGPALIIWMGLHCARRATSTTAGYYPIISSRFILAVAPVWLVPSALPRGSSSQIVNDWFWAESWYVPVAAYLNDDVSDMGEVRLFLVGRVLGGVLYLTSAAMAAGSSSIWWILLVGIVASVLVTLGLIVVFDTGPWTWIFFTAGETPGTVVERQRFKRLRHSILSTVTLLIFKLNRVARWCQRHLRELTETDWAVEYGETLPPDGKDAKYRYAQLGQGQIRLLTVLPGCPPAPIRGRLEVVDLESSPFFEAISYVWGQGEFDRFVIVDGKRLDVMGSAYAVLQRRRSRREERVLWIDQLCIDQKNVKERESQVRLMSKLYNLANRVVAWLGHSDSAYQLQSFFAELQYKQKGLGLWGEQLKNATGGGEGPQWKALCEFFQNDWFTRIWIVQEATFSRELHLLYGDVCLDWDLVGEGIAVLWQWDMLKSVPALNGSYFSDARSRVFTGLRNADAMLEFRGDVDYNRIFSVFTALENCVGFRSSDQRDKIYALTNIFDDIRITPDYGVPTSTLFTETMRGILRRANSLDALSWAGTGYGPQAVEGLPSWVPDWNRTRLANTSDHIWYAAGSAYDPVVTFGQVDSTSIVVLEGWNRDRIAHLSPSLEIQGDTDLEASIKIQWSWYAYAEDMAAQYALRHHQETLLESFMRTMIGDRISVTNKRDRSTPQECLKVHAQLQEYFLLSSRARAIAKYRGLREGVEAPRVARFLDNMMDPSKMYQLVNKKLQLSETRSEPYISRLTEEEIIERFTEVLPPAEEFLAQASVLGRRFCVTEQGRMAIVPRDSMKGDLLCVMKGGRAPLILRGPRKLAEGHPEAYEFVGSCYIHGLMDRGWIGRPADKFTLV